MAGHHDRQLHPNAEELPGLVILRFDAPLFFANAREVPRRDSTVGAHRAAARPWIVLAAEPITDVDTTAADMLHELDEELNAKGISLVFAELKDPVRRKLERYELIGHLDPAHFFPTLEGAIEAFREQTGARWTRSEVTPRRRLAQDHPGRDRAPAASRSYTGDVNRGARGKRAEIALMATEAARH